MGTTFVSKFAIDKKRPNGDDQSFPSGHATISFSLAEFLSSYSSVTDGNMACQLMLLQHFISYSRIEADQHNPIDVIGWRGHRYRDQLSLYPAVQRLEYSAGGGFFIFWHPPEP
jgi:hypothetical protein